jgi:ubiquinone/menaquinone biosynthesis C-methylase UbiE
MCPEAITSGVFVCPGVLPLIDARKLPFPDGSLRAIVMTHVMHHIADAERFLAEAQRALVPGGRILMIEPWVSAWSRFVYTRLHPEPFRPEASAWAFCSSALAAAWSFRAWKGLERLLAPLMGKLAMFAFIAVERR